MSSFNSGNRFAIESIQGGDMGSGSPLSTEIWTDPAVLAPTRVMFTANAWTSDNKHVAVDQPIYGDLPIAATHFEPVRIQPSIVALSQDKYNDGVPKKPAIVQYLQFARDAAAAYKAREGETAVRSNAATINEQLRTTQARFRPSRPSHLVSRDIEQTPKRGKATPQSFPQGGVAEMPALMLSSVQQKAESVVSGPSGMVSPTGQNATRGRSSSQPQPGTVTELVGQFGQGLSRRSVGTGDEKAQEMPTPREMVIRAFPPNSFTSRNVVGQTVNADKLKNLIQNLRREQNREPLTNVGVRVDTFLGGRFGQQKIRRGDDEAYERVITGLTEFVERESTIDPGEAKKLEDLFS